MIVSASLAGKVAQLESPASLNSLFSQGLTAVLLHVSPLQPQFHPISPLSEQDLHSHTQGILTFKPSSFYCYQTSLCSLVFSDCTLCSYPLVDKKQFTTSLGLTDANRNPVRNVLNQNQASLRSLQFLHFKEGPSIIFTWLDLSQLLHFPTGLSFSQHCLTHSSACLNLDTNSWSHIKIKISFISMWYSQHLRNNLTEESKVRNP